MPQNQVNVLGHFVFNDELINQRFYALGIAEEILFYGFFAIKKIETESPTLAGTPKMYF